MELFERTMYCPWCGRLHELHGSDGGGPPEPGDLSLCWGCRKVGVFAGARIRKPTPQEQEDIDADPDVRAAIHAMRESHTPDEAGRLLGWNP